jgi:hypothetical protein
VRRSLLVLALVAALLACGAVAAARSTPSLRAAGPSEVEGTEAGAPFTVADRTVRQVRYVDRGTLRYTFALTNGGRLPLTVHGLAGDRAEPRLFDLVRLSPVELAPGETAAVTLTLTMNGCETLSSRSGSFVSELALRATQAGVFDDVVTVALPEELHTGSAREATCPEATATSRPQG